MILKKCKHCGSFFPAKLHTLFTHCKKKGCQKRFKGKLAKVKHTRVIAIDWFDVYDSTYPLENGEYERVCRYCGARLLGKKQNYLKHRRWCSKHSKMMKILDVYWNVTRDQYLWERHQSDIVKYSNLPLGSIACEICGKYVSIKDEIGKSIEVHHKRPVHTLPLNVKGIMQIWDFKNLIALCHECHQQQNHYLRQPFSSQINKLE